ncbi:hypothetical protein BTM36_22130 [Herbaspirillum sp. VT-16-41]|nr:hypothetical protein BTM36_22130 [Herbaspirillum sp. VT-16-41]
MSRNTITRAQSVKAPAPETGVIKNVSDQLADLMAMLFEKSGDVETKAARLQNLIGLALDLSVNINKMLREVEAAEEAAEAAQ